jgi:drug/metabolite transporter (DMT)-like permease
MRQYSPRQLSLSVMTSRIAHTGSHAIPHVGARAFGWTDVSLLLMSTIWAINFTVVKFAAATLGQLAFTGLRVAIASVMLIAISALHKETLPPWKDVKWLLFYGAIGNGIYQLCFVGGVARTRVATAALMVSATPAIIALVSRIRGLERLSRRASIGVALSMAGVAMVILDKSGARSGRSTMLGVLLMCAAVICWTIFTVGLQPFTQRIDPAHITSITMVGGILPLMFVSTVPLVRLDWGGMPANAWWAVLYATAASTVLAFYIWFRGLRILGPTRTAIYANVQPAIAIAVAWLTINEVPTLLQGIGTITVMTGVLLTRS